MRSIESLLPRLALLLACSLPGSLGGCLSGTSTDTDNTVALSGRVLLSDGRPAAYAVLTARSGEVTAAADGTPSWRVLAIDTADSAGGYRIEMTGVRDAWLEARERADNPRQAFPQAYLARFAMDSLPLPDTLRLSGSGTIEGRISDRSKPLPEGAWIAVPGTAAVARAGTPDSAGSVAFRLEAVPTGSWPLVVVTVKPGAAGPIPGTPPVVHVQPDTVKELGPVFYNETGKGAAALR